MDAGWRAYISRAADRIEELEGRELVYENEIAALKRALGESQNRPRGMHGSLTPTQQQRELCYRIDDLEARGWKWGECLEVGDDDGVFFEAEIMAADGYVKRGHGRNPLIAYMNAYDAMIKEKSKK